MTVYHREAGLTGPVGLEGPGLGRLLRRPNLSYVTSGGEGAGGVPSTCSEGKMQLMSLCFQMSQSFSGVYLMCVGRLLEMIRLDVL